MGPQDCQVFNDKPGAMAYRDALRDISTEMHVPFIHRYDLMQSWLDHHLITPAELQSGDGLHMGDGGYALLGHAVTDAILNASASAKTVASR